MNWNDFLRPYQTFRPDLLSEGLMEHWGNETWGPGDNDSKAAGKLHTQLASRITTQTLGYLEGDEKTAMKSVFSLFETTRNIVDEFHGCRHFDALAWDVLNNHVRPFTAKWHRESERGMLSALDATDEFRGELTELQEVLRVFDYLLVHLRDGRPAPRSSPSTQSTKIIAEMREQVPWDISPAFSEIRDGTTLAAINNAEKAAVQCRRKHYKIPASKEHAIALALSGGGIRSATFSLGVLVALARRNILPQIDYLSTVSGGGYVGSFLSTYLSTPGNPEIGLERDKLPFLRKAGEAEALRHLRHHSKYLATGSLWQRLKSVGAQLYGMLLNSVGLLLVIMLLANVERPLRCWLALQGPWHVGTLLLIVLATGAVGGLALLRSRDRSWWTLADLVVTVPIVLLALWVLWHFLGFMHTWIQHMWDARIQSPSAAQRTWLPGDAKIWFSIVGALAGAIPVIGSALAGGASRLAARTAIVFAALTAIAAPIFLLCVYLLIYQMLGGPDISLAWGLGTVTPSGLQWSIIVIGFTLYLLLLDINLTSPHRFYRRKLAEAYLIRPAKQSTNASGTASNTASDQAGTTSAWASICGWLCFKKKSASAAKFENGISIRLSKLADGQHRAPYHLINCALNVPGSRNPKMQGRLTDFFLFSPAFSGSPLTGYHPTSEWETVDPHLDLATAMAISGAAAAPQMGLGTVKRFSFWLALLNVRLGYWARKPHAWQAYCYLGVPGLWFLLKEILGTMDETSPWLNLSDGGHIENLGMYELLRRRCKYIIAIDGEHDAKMTFQALTTLQRLAEIDFGVRIDINLDDLRLNNSGLTRSHFKFCRIYYPTAGRDSPMEIGYLLYLKLSLTGNEGEFIRRYRLDEPAFPHHSTADQFFTEAQFEAYRSLGEHVGDKLFLRAIVGNLADSLSVNIEEWFEELGKSLLEPH